MKDKFNTGAKNMITYGMVMAQLNEISKHIPSGGFAGYSRTLNDGTENERVSGFTFSDHATEIRLENLLRGVGIRFSTWLSDLNGRGELHIDPAHTERADKLFGGWQSNVVVSVDPRNAVAMQKWKEYV